MPRISAAQAGGQNVLAFLDMLAWSEGTSTSRLTQCDGYDVIVNGLVDGKSVPEIFSDFTDHPFANRPAKVFNSQGEKSSAAGRYQQLYRYWPAYKKQLGLPDFSPISQDLLAIQLIKERKALDDIKAGRVRDAITKCSNIWASLPGNGYGQRQHKVEDLVAQYRAAGGVVV